ncbi:hypothetical protein [Gordonia malaquae]|uniref:hypothetical protein n=1 Tax=Gordonia malaquae TaxID=410332 RepID=UPI00301B5953
MTALDLTPFAALKAPRPRTTAELRETQRAVTRAKLRDDVRDLNYLYGAWPYVCGIRERGTPRHWVQHDQRRAAGMLRMSELERIGVRGTAISSPADVSALDALSQIASTVTWIHNEITRTLPQYRAEVWQPPRRASLDPRSWILIVLRLLPQAHAATIDDDEPIAHWVEHRLAPVVSVVARLLGDARDGQELAGICPWCTGRTPKGTHFPTMRIHYPAEMDLGQPLDPDTAHAEMAGRGVEPLIVCHGLSCTPPSTAYGQQWKGMPAWAAREWDWLAKQLIDPKAGDHR